MLISMPTGTSTIFGVFQAILALLGCETGRTSPSPSKLVPNEKFASEIFSPKSLSILCCSAKEIGAITSLRLKPKRDQRLPNTAGKSRCATPRLSFGERRIKNL